MTKQPMHLRAQARLADGGLMALPPVLFEHVAALRAAGNTGRQIINSLWTDDWAAPPLRVHLAGQDAAGRAVEHVIEYRD